ncbi:hypothetical protein GUA87_05605 [Sneathiella sp. P13V-1]|uniref:hypothetical protein n=1 Tax=Sneathiella sp. P13V-1 TaxID=2697366 RepID=UPI00187BC1D3|nr:hypothetical protein [Sneathiella sp. P13V-1]MBE7636311.1 hypothetical protein [Sneathiella sp. P13V-1]
MKKLIISAVALLMSCTSAMAATTTFDFLSGPNGSIGWTRGTLNYSVDGLNLAVSSAEYYQGAIYDSGHIRQYNGHGLAIWNESDNDHQIDGSGYNDVAYFDFGTQEVKLKSVSFTYNDNGDRFALFADNDNDGYLELIDSSLNANPTDTFEFLGALMFSGTEFGIGAIGRYHDFKLAALTVEKISAIPLPAALPLYGAGVALLGFIGWRRKRSA